jgi:prevent-host-death family protein
MAFGFHVNNFLPHAQNGCQMQTLFRFSTPSNAAAARRLSNLKGFVNTYISLTFPYSGCTFKVYKILLICINAGISKGFIIMLEVNVKEARSKLSSLLDRVERGEEIIISRRGKKVALLVSPEKKNTLPSLKEFRASISTTGKPLSNTVIDMRQEESY